MKQSVWEQEYRNVDSLWGFNPNNILSQYVDMLPESGKVLDIGIGEGRNALFFAKRGFAVEGIDISETAVERCLEFSKEHNLNVKASVQDITSFEIEPNKYSLIILSNVLNFFPDRDIKIIIEKVKNGLLKNGLVYISAFDDKEPGRKKAPEKYEQLAEHTFYNERLNMFLHYFTRSELEGFFADYKMISLSQSYSLDISHGQPHYHSTLEIMSQKS
ncbi:class I SAM-dependent methyltransferase [Peribacillus muralis]|uniref:class I SAM-dependent methyltransferase n=1 Tax=Peribacillus muralis TaxID=264697 RepID=UPI001F4D87A8|nr:class I SAM-dependent methyltransferase [Peribacillus muralis]MCK1995142.1 class I SAM-dependent methyltransferase [Peribacillus muralis]MCK2015775.1 class I SAM-dependent methyltransferase [Peribacillus muralis]